MGTPHPTATASPAARVSVVIPAYNTEAYLEECLESVRAQRGPFELEIVVVDDGSTDRSAEVASRHGGVRVLRQPNCGPAAARNRGIAATSGEFVAFLDADDLWPAAALAARLEVLQRHPEAGLVFGDCRQFEEQSPWPRTLFDMGSWGLSAWGDGGTVPDAYARLLEENFITTGSVVVRRRVLEEARGYAEDLRLVEDLDLWLRIARRHTIAWCARVCLLRRRHGANTSSDAEAMSLAYLEVLRRQRAAEGPDGERAISARLARLAAQEYMHLSAIALRRHQGRAALGWAWCSLQTWPTARSFVRLVGVAVRAFAEACRAASGNRAR
jgi:glycosyltransferase involved in cell wall biosynthesis